MQFDFDKIIDRRGTSTVKYGALQTLFGREDLLPLWVADMDFESPKCVTEALRKRLEHEVYGYTITPESYWETLKTWNKEQHGWDIEREWLTYIPGIVKGIGLVINFFVKPDEKVIIQPPVYHPFRLTPQGNHREVVCNPLIEEADGSYRMDFEGLERVIDEKCRVLILSNPHNPAGIIWDTATLARLAEICDRHGIIVISDEIHSDMPLWGKTHTPFAKVSDAAARCSITFAAPSKTFNIAGLVSSYAVVPNDALRKPFYEWLEANELNHAQFLAIVASQAAYTEGDPWRRAMLAYVEDNIRFVEQYCAENMPKVRPVRPDASFLVWLDCRQLGLTHDALIDLFVNKAKLALNDGEMFGKEGSGFMRLNVGTPRAVLAQALDQLKAALEA